MISDKYRFLTEIEYPVWGRAPAESKIRRGKNRRNNCMIPDRLLRQTTYIVVLTALNLAVAGVASAATPNVTAASSHGLSLNASGSACAAGQNEYGELGDGTLVDRWTPVPVANLSASLSGISTGYDH